MKSKFRPDGYKIEEFHGKIILIPYLKTEVIE